MRTRAAVLAVASVACAVVGAGVLIPYWAGRDDAGEVIFVTGFAVVALAGGITGGVVAARVPGNRVGWLILGQGVAAGVALALEATAVPPLPGSTVALLVSELLATFVAYGFTGLLLLLFPDGRPLSPAWCAYAWFFAAVALLAAVAGALHTATLDPLPDNPFRPGGTVGQLVGHVASLLSAIALPALGLCAVALVVRLSRSHGVQRQQLKLFTYCATMAGLGFGLAGATSGPLSDVAWVAGMVGMLLLPVAAGLAVLRHGLYGIDVVIKRTLVYSSLTATLLATYLVLVLLLQVLLRPVAGRSDVAVAASTLAVAAMFGPLRARIQAAVDRRFFRSRYDAALTLDAFADHLRDELDLDALVADLGDVVRQTMQPTHVALWLREAVPTVAVTIPGRLPDTKEVP
ncbi:MAG: hypothetical protein JOZ82_01470 [Marmoricola sp.]|nr:hypothetical protein [Marmoricola sp.]